MAPPGLGSGPIPDGSGAKPIFGGNVGRKSRADGFTAGSPEALAADREKERLRKQRQRAEKRAAEPPPPLPSGAGPVPGVAGPGADDPFAPAGDLGGPLVDPVLDWTPTDFRDCAPELVELCEAWRVDAHTKRAVEGKLPRRVVDEIAKDAAFPPGSKRSLSTSSPVTLAKMFNSLRVPITMKPIITMAPALVYIIVRDLMTGQRINKLIADEQDRAATSAAPAVEKN